MPTRFGKFVLNFLMFLVGLWESAHYFVKGLAAIICGILIITVCSFSGLLMYALIREEPWVLIVPCVLFIIYMVGRILSH